MYVFYVLKVAKHVSNGYLHFQHFQWTIGFHDYNKQSWLDIVIGRKRRSKRDSWASSWGHFAANRRLLGSIHSAKNALASMKHFKFEGSMPNLFAMHVIVWTHEFFIYVCLPYPFHQLNLQVETSKTSGVEAHGPITTARWTRQEINGTRVPKQTQNHLWTWFSTKNSWLKQTENLR